MYVYNCVCVYVYRGAVGLSGRVGSQTDTCINIYICYIIHYMLVSYTYRDFVGRRTTIGLPDGYFSNLIFSVKALTLKYQK